MPKRSNKPQRGHIPRSIANVRLVAGESRDGIVDASKSLAPAGCFIGKAEINAIFGLPFGEVLKIPFDEVFRSFCIEAFLFACGNADAYVDDVVNVHRFRQGAVKRIGEVLGHFHFPRGSDSIVADLDGKAFWHILEIEIDVDFAFIEEAEGDFGSLGGSFRFRCLGGRIFRIEASLR